VPHHTGAALLAGALLLSPAGLEAQTPARRDSIVQVARSLIEGAHYAALITTAPDGSLQARTVDPFAPDSAFVVWIGTNPRTRKVAEIRRDPRVTLYWFDPKALGYVTLHGRARLVNDSAEKARRFKPAWAAFYPDRARDYLLIEVQPERMEVVSPAHGITGDSMTWRPPTVILPRR
jgi:general stress protein 26